MLDKERLNILLVDDQPAKLLSYEVILGELGENLIKANSASEALSLLLKTGRCAGARRRLHARSRRISAGRDDPPASAIRKDRHHLHLRNPSHGFRPREGLQFRRRRLHPGTLRARTSARQGARVPRIAPQDATARKARRGARRTSAGTHQPARRLNGATAGKRRKAPSSAGRGEYGRLARRYCLKQAARATPA